MTNSRVKAEFDFLYQCFVYLNEAEKNLVQRNYKQWTQKNRCDEYKEIKDLLEKVKTFFDDVMGEEYSTFRYGVNRGNKLA